MQVQSQHLKQLRHHAQQDHSHQAHAQAGGDRDATQPAGQTAQAGVTHFAGAEHKSGVILPRFPGGAHLRIQSLGRLNPAVVTIFTPIFDHARPGPAVAYGLPPVLVGLGRHVRVAYQVMALPYNLS